jgi:hypothetical protein
MTTNALLRNLPAANTTYYHGALVQVLSTDRDQAGFEIAEVCYPDEGPHADTVIVATEELSIQ